MNALQEYMKATINSAGVELQDVAALWTAELEGRWSEAAQLGNAALDLPDRLTPSERGHALMGCIRLIHLDTVKNANPLRTWPDLPYTGLDYRQFTQLSDYPAVDMQEQIIDLANSLCERDISFNEQMLCEVLELTRHRNAGHGVFCVAIVDHIVSAAKQTPSKKFQDEFIATCRWLSENEPWHREDYWSAFRAEALEQFRRI